MVSQPEARFEKSWFPSKMGGMKTTVELPDKLVREVKLRAVEEGRKLKDVFAELIVRGLEAESHGSTTVHADNATLKKRRELVNRFVAGDWEVELPGVDASQKRDRTKAKKRAQMWRD